MENIKDVYCIIEKESFTDSWFTFAKGGSLSPTYIDFYINKETALSARDELKRQNPKLEFDIMKTQFESFAKYWTRCIDWSYE